MVDQSKQSVLLKRVEANRLKREQAVRLNIRLRAEMFALVDKGRQDGVKMTVLAEAVGLDRSHLHTALSAYKKEA